MHLVCFAQSNQLTQVFYCTHGIDSEATCKFYNGVETQSALIDNQAYQQRPDLDPNLKTQVPCLIYTIQKERLWHCTLFEHSDLL